MPPNLLILLFTTPSLTSPYKAQPPERHYCLNTSYYQYPSWLVFLLEIIHSPNEDIHWWWKCLPWFSNMWIVMEVKRMNISFNLEPFAVMAAHTYSSSSNKVFFSYLQTRYGLMRFNFLKQFKMLYKLTIPLEQIIRD